MKTYTESEFKEILRLHKLWLCNDVEGVRADLSYEDLSGYDLRGVNLSCADLSYAYLRGADLRGADLRGADLKWCSLRCANLKCAKLNGVNLSDVDLSYAYLRGADLRGADLRGADLEGADLRDADLRDADLRGADLDDCVGNSKQVKSLQLSRYPITYTKDSIQIGCKNYSIAEWFNFTDGQIDDMDRGALDWWNKHRNLIKLTIETSPAIP